VGDQVVLERLVDLGRSSAQGTHLELLERSHHRTGQFSSYDRDIHGHLDERQWCHDEQAVHDLCLPPVLGDSRFEWLSRHSGIGNVQTTGNTCITKVYGEQRHKSVKYKYAYLSSSKFRCQGVIISVSATKLGNQEVASNQAITTEEWEQRLGGDVRRLRTRRRWTQVELARHANISLSSVQSLERGGGSTLSTLIRVARALGRTDWLVSFAPEEPKVSPLQLLREREKEATAGRTRVRHPATPE
jgi:transcriptional regulator with XRE-family HTH domain